MTRLINQSDMRTPNGFGIEAHCDSRPNVSYSAMANGSQSHSQKWCQRSVRLRYVTLALLAGSVLALTISLIICICLLAIRGDSESGVFLSLDSPKPQPQPQSETQTPPLTDELQPTANLTARLPNDVLPLHYKLTVFPDIYCNDSEKFYSHGWLLITFRMLRPTSRIVLHASAFEIDANATRLSVGEALDDEEPLLLNDSKHADDEYDHPRAELLPVAQFHHDELTYYELVFNETLVQDATYTLRLEWISKIYNWTHGLYYSTYESEDSVTHYMAVTQFEPTYARQAFPCFDEPSLKAHFSVRIVRRSSHRAIANAALARTTSVWIHGELYEVDVFKLTPKMSTYVVAFVVCDLQYTSVTDNGIVYRFWGRPSMLSELNYLMEVTPRILNYMQQLFKVPYSLEKLDSVGVPDFAAQAMENWGLVTYMETCYYYNSSKDPLAQRQQLVLLVAHEMAHMWFGNLVTMKWWDDVWLKEGLATYFSTVASQFAEPSFDFIAGSVVQLTQTLTMDSLQVTRGVHAPVSSLLEIEAVFDFITYEKGAALCRTMNNILGESIFMKGIQIYLNWFQFQSTTYHDLLRSFSVQSSLDDNRHDMLAMMENWLLASNFPVVTATRIDSASSSLSINFTQQLFLVENKLQKQQSWHLPVTILTKAASENNTGILWLTNDKPETTLQFNVSQTDARWFVINPGYRAFYRVNYDASNWRELELILQRSHTDLDKFTRVQLLDDASNLAAAELLDFQTFLNITLYLRNEREYHPWQVALTSLGNMRKLLVRTDFEELFLEYLRYLLEPVYSYVGWETNDTTPLTTVMLRSLILQESCEIGIQSCVDKAKAVFSEWSAGSDSGMAPELTKTAGCTAMKYGTQEEWKRLFVVYSKAIRALDRVSLASALACTQDATLIDLLLTTLLTETDLGSQEFIESFGVLCGNSAAHEIVKTKFFDNLQKLWVNNPTLVLLRFVFGESANQTDLEDLRSRKAQFEERIPSIETFYTAVGLLEKNIRWVEQHEQTIKAWLVQLRALFSTS